MSPHLPDGDHLMPQPQSCRSCEYLGRLVWRNPDLYRCGAPLPLFPDSVVVHGDVDDRRKMSPDDGRSCPTWEPAETESRT